MGRFLPLVAVLLVAGCGAKIGDACHTNVDCSPLGNRFCDTASPGGYCTQEDCGLSSCPSEAVCIRFFSALADEPCHVDASVAIGKGDCQGADERCVCDQSDASGKCLTTGTDPNGHCAPAATERHWCMLSCSHDSDCRSGYQCRRTGTQGAEPIPSFEMSTGTPANFCAPTPTPF